MTQLGGPPSDSPGQELLLPFSMVLLYEPDRILRSFDKSRRAAHTIRAVYYHECNLKKLRWLLERATYAYDFSTEGPFDPARTGPLKIKYPLLRRHHLFPRLVNVLFQPHLVTTIREQGRPLPLPSSSNIRRSGRRK